MPELAEVETVVRDLRKVILNNKFILAKVFRKDLRIPFPENLSDTLVNSTIVSVERRSKYILINMSNNQTLIIHLGMSGRFYAQAQFIEEKHTHFYAQLSNKLYLNFIDPRRFGLITLCETDKINTHKLFKHLGPEPLTEDFKVNEFYNKLQKIKRPIKNVIMDQEIVVGVGNIYAAESLFRAGISPLRIASSISFDETVKLHTQIIDVLKLAIASGGSSLRDYRKPDGETGGFQDLFKVYAREKEPCVTCNKPITRIVQSGRSTFFCENCQN